MRIFLCILALCSMRVALAQDAAAPAPLTSHPDSTPANAADIETLRQEVKELTSTVRSLQQQVKDQQAIIEKASLNGSKSESPDEGTSSVKSKPGSGGNGARPTEDSSPISFPTEDASVVSSAPAAKPQSSGVNANGTATGETFPTSDASVVSSSPPGSSIVAGGSSLTAPITVGGGKAYMNMSLDGMFAVAASSAHDLDHIEAGDHDPQQRGFNARNLELVLDGAVDPYFEGFANIVFKLDNDNETEVEVEEAFMQTTNLPFSLQLKGGQFFAAFGRINPTHPHTWDFADAPLVHGRLLGPDGLRGVGAQVSWTLPLPWYSQLIVAAQNGRGGTGYSFRNQGDDGVFFDRMTIDHEIRGLGDFVWVPRLENSFNLSDTQTVLLGVSGAFGPNDTGDHAHTQVYGGDFLYKWKSSHADGGFPFVKWQTEWMYRRFEADRGVDKIFPVAETFDDWGLYSQVVWGFRKGWVAGLRGDYLDMEDSRFTADPDRQSRSRISANLTWYPTEFSKIRLQYNHDFLEENFFLADRDVDSVFLQFEFILGAHGAHKF